MQTEIWIALIELAGSFVWPTALIGVLILFRANLAALLASISRIDSPWGSIETQATSKDAPAVDASKIAAHADGFFQKDELAGLLSDSGLLMSGEKIGRSLSLFRTAKQQTWLVATDHSLFCILDDDNTRASGMMIQWRLSLDQIKAVRAYISERGNTVVDIGPRKRWLYSARLHPNPIGLEEDITSIVQSPLYDG